MTESWSARGTAQLLHVEDQSLVGAARRAAMGMGGAVGFGETDVAAVGVIATELAGNLVKHARGGHLLLQPLAHGERAGVELLAIDRGPGMADPDRCIVDGYSTAGTPGTGLGAVRRMAHEFDLHSQPGKGTVLVARRCAGQAPLSAGQRVGAVCVPHPSEPVSGDDWCAVVHGERGYLMVVDGLGHGMLAHAAAERAVELFRELAPRPPGELLSRLHDPLRGTRGAAILVAEVDSAGGAIRCAGVGNVAGTVVSGDQTRSLVSHSGIVGHQMVRVQEFTYPWTEGAMLVIASDGIRTQWRLDAYAGVARRHPSVVAALLWRDFSRGRDDATVLVLGPTNASHP